MAKADKFTLPLGTTLGIYLLAVGNHLSTIRGSCSLGCGRVLGHASGAGLRHPQDAITESGRFGILEKTADWVLNVKQVVCITNSWKHAATMCYGGTDCCT